MGTCQPALRPARRLQDQPSHDAEQYLKGAVWTMQMYIAGRCPDYCYTYTGASPSAPEILQVRQLQTASRLVCCCVAYLLGRACWRAPHS
jgi:hypothetical protein